jgi:hypothetical protein
MCTCRVFIAQADWKLIHTSHKDTEESKMEASITLGDVTPTNLSGDNRLKGIQFTGEIPSLPIRRSGRLISPHNEHSIYLYRISY